MTVRMIDFPKGWFKKEAWSKWNHGHLPKTDPYVKHWQRGLEDALWPNQSTTDSSQDSSPSFVSRTGANSTSPSGEEHGWGTQLRSNPPKGGEFVFDDPTQPCQPTTGKAGPMVVPALAPTIYRYKFQHFAIRCGPFQDKADADHVAADTRRVHNTPVQVEQGGTMEWWVTYQFRFPVLTP